MRPALLLMVAALVPSASLAASPAELFSQRCAMCHQASGAGLPGQFPRIASRVASIAQSKTGRHYLALIVLNGMVGSIDVDGQHITGLMPSMAALPDQSLADLLNHALQLAPAAKGKKPTVFTASEIAAVRKEGSIGPTAVGKERSKLSAAGLLP